MASVIIKRESGSSERTVSVVSGGKVVSSKKVSGDEFKSAKRSSGGGSGGAAILLGNELIADFNAGVVSSPSYSRVAVSSSGSSRLLSPFESSGYVGLSTEQGSRVVPLLSSGDVPSPVSRLTQADIDAIPASELRAQNRASRIAERERLANVRGELASEAFFEREEKRASRVTPLSGLLRGRQMPGEAFISGFDEVLSTGYISEREGEGVINDFFRVNVAGGSAAGLASFGVQPVLTGLGNTELAAIGAGRILGVPSAIGAIGLTSAEGYGLGVLSRARDLRSVPVDARPFLVDNTIFRQAVDAERSADPNFVGRALSGINLDFSSNPSIFSSSARSLLSEQGFEGAQLDLGVRALEARRSRAPTNELFRTLNAGRFSEIYGRDQLSLLAPTGGFASRGFSYGRALFLPGVTEIRGELASERASIGSDLPFLASGSRLDSARSLLPKVSFDGGLTIASQSRLGQDVGLGVLGGLTSSFLGGLVGAGASAPKGFGARSASSRGIGKASNLFANIADPSEPFTDLLAFDVGSPARIPVLSGSPSLALSPLAPLPSGLSFASAPQISPAVFVQSRTNIPALPSFVNVLNVSPNTNVPSLVPSLDSFGVRSSVPVPPRSSVPVPPRSNVPVSPNVNTLINPFSLVPVSPNPNVPVNVPVSPNVPAFASVPVVVPSPRLPPPLPLALDVGGSGYGGRRKRDVSYIDELSASLNLFSADVGRNRRVAFRDPLAGLRGGLFGR